MMLYDLPTSLDINDTTWEIRSDFRDVLNIVSAFDDPDLEAVDKVYICLYGMYVDFDKMPEDMYSEAFEKAMEFIDYGSNDDDGKPRGRKTMDWEQDAHMLFPAVNHIAGYEVRTVEYLHWWTFLGFFMEISEGVYSTVLSLRAKKNSGKKLEKWEQEWWKKNKSICEIKPRLSAEELAAKARLNAMINNAMSGGG